MEETKVFVCNRSNSKKGLVKVQLEIPERVLEGYKAKSKGTVYSPKQVMENMLTNWIDGVKASES